MILKNHPFLYLYLYSIYYLILCLNLFEIYYLNYLSFIVVLLSMFYSNHLIFYSNPNITLIYDVIALSIHPLYLSSLVTFATCSTFLSIAILSINSLDDYLSTSKTFLYIK